MNRRTVTRTKIFTIFVLLFPQVVSPSTLPPDPTAGPDISTAAPDSTTPGPDQISTTLAPDQTTTLAPDPTTTTQSPTTTTVPLCGQTHTAGVTLNYLETPNYPSNYPSDTTCTYLITGPDTLALTITFNAFYLEDHSYCSYDKLHIYDGPDSTSTLIGTYCGTSSPPPVISSSNNVFIVFESDYSVEYSGAQWSYSTYNDSYPLCKSSYAVYSADATVRTFTNADYPSLYQNNVDEYYLVENNDDSKLLILNLTYMNVERGTDCVYDRITVYNGACTGDGILFTHCGTYLSRWELSGSEHLVHFHTDASVQRYGFSMQYFTGVGGTASPTTTTTTLGPPVTAEIGLINDVLTNYSIGNLPARNLSIPVQSTVDVSLVGVNGLDEVQQKLTTTILFNVKWTDANIQWPVSKISGITKLLIPQNDIWKPDIALLNSFTQIQQMGSKFMFVVVQHDGRCVWSPYQILESTCLVDMTNYPYDTQKCELQFSTWAASSSQVDVTVGENGMAKHESFVENSEWHVQDISQRSETINGQSTAIFTLTLKRNPSFIVFYIALPIVLLSFLNAFTFALPAQSGEKASFSITVFLSFVVYVIVTFDKMPESSDSISLFAMYILIMTCLSAFTLMLSVVQLRMMTLQTKHKPVTRCTIAFTKFILGLQTKMLCISQSQFERAQERKERIEAAEQRRRSRALPDDDDDIDDDEGDEDTVWIEFVSALDFICFWVFLIGTLALTLGFLVNLSLQ